MKYFILFLLMVGFTSACVDINSASLSELDEIVWVGPATAQKIVDARPFDNLDDLIRVYGIGEIKVAKIKEEGVACVEVDDDVPLDVEEDEVEEDEVENVRVEEKPVLLLLKKTEIISLNEEIGNEGEIVYESNNFRAVNLAPYILSLILIALVMILVWEKF